MKNLKNVLIMLTMVLTLGVMSCETTNVEPDPQLDGLTLADFDGTWNLESVTYKEVTYNDCANPTYLGSIDESLTTAVWTGISFVINGSKNEITSFIDCNGTVTGPAKNIVFDSNDLTISFSSAGDYKFKIVNYNLTSTPFTASIKLVEKGHPYQVLNAVHNVVKQ